jgi:hypothetical protein
MGWGGVEIACNLVYDFPEDFSALRFGEESLPPEGYQREEIRAARHKNPAEG